MGVWKPQAQGVKGDLTPRSQRQAGGPCFLLVLCSVQLQKADTAHLAMQHLSLGCDTAPMHLH